MPKKTLSTPFLVTFILATATPFASAVACPQWMSTYQGRIANDIARYNATRGRMRGGNTADLDANDAVREELIQFARDIESEGFNDLSDDQLAERFRDRLVRRLPARAEDFRSMEYKQLGECVPGARLVFMAIKRLQAQAQAKREREQPTHSIGPGDPGPPEDTDPASGGKGERSARDTLAVRVTTERVQDGTTSFGNGAQNFIAPRYVDKKVLTVTSKADRITINSIVVNRGNCSIFALFLPADLKFGESYQAQVMCEPLEIVVQTSEGTQEFNLNQ